MTCANLKTVQSRYRVFLEDGVARRSAETRDPAYEHGSESTVAPHNRRTTPG